MATKSIPMNGIYKCATCGERLESGSTERRENGKWALAMTVTDRDIMVNRLTMATSLTDLLAALRAFGSRIRSDAVVEQMLARLPTFGGEDPADTNGVYSWDATHLLVGYPRSADWQIVERT